VQKLTNATKTLFAKTKKNTQTKVAISWLVEMFQSPNMRSFIFDILEQKE
jgi:hypothetical protein